MSALFTFVLLGAAAAILVACRARRAAGRDPLGPPPTGELPDPWLALVLGALLWLSLMLVLDPIAKGLRIDGDPVFFELAGTLANVVVALALRRAAASGTLRPTISKPRLVATGVAAGVVVTAGAVLASYAIVSLLEFAGRPEPTQDVVKIAKAATGAHRVVIYSCAGVLAPFAEEVFFRGILFPSLARVSGVRVALLLQAAAFGLVHVVAAPETWPVAIPLAFVGWCAGRTYLRTGSLLAPIALHATFNAVNLVAMNVG